MSEMTATRMTRWATLAVVAGAWCACAWLLARTSVPSLALRGVDAHRYFSPRSLHRAVSYTRGTEVLWLLGTAATLATLVALSRLLPKTVRSLGLGRVGSAVIVGLVVIVALWFVGLPFSFAALWCQNHLGLGPFDILGPSRHVILWNTLLDGRFTRGEKDAVIAHELGHVRSRHIIKGIGWAALVVLPTLWLLALATRRRGGVGDPANLPFALLVLVVLGLLTAPFQNAISRRYESEADWRSLNATRDPASARKLFQSFERTSLENPNPPLWDYLWLEDHPTLMQRIAMAERWRERTGR